ncbi:sterol desaturase family protein [Paucibacter sp. Y2R2-4]|uniref:sterol desaturase family protein n=1 Tax=Paucibacter sp. Y2R2-4 TaxID=2893553 RepID=UPI0021E3D95F|nr:sterol desaturase family protein [Paucibacter sp. Y2R2-4]MCV2349623.1 sterol desaturase family protein [Paucibacter sp. Y2R2-4]
MDSPLPWLLALLGLVVFSATLEGLVRSFVLRLPYDWAAFAASLADFAGRRAIDGLGLSLAAPLLNWVYAHRLQTLTLTEPLDYLLLFLGQELCFYGYHRAAHRVRWFWATHAVHHSPNELSLAAALRLGWTGKLSGTAIFFLPLIWLGFSPQAVAAAVAGNLLYQFWLHATWIPKLPAAFEWVFNTPSHHRVHHGCNSEYLDCNFGGVLIVFDRLFGSFVEERKDLEIRYGLSTPLYSYNPLQIATHAWAALARDVWGAKSSGAVLKTLLGPPDHGPKQQDERRSTNRLQ